MELRIEVIDSDGRRLVSERVSKPIVTIGSQSGSDVVIADKHVSRSHGRLDITDGRVVFRDHSTNGSFVGGRRIVAHELSPGDEIQVGTHTLRVHFAGEHGTVVMQQQTVPAKQQSQPAVTQPDLQRPKPHAAPQSILERPMGFHKSFDVLQKADLAVDAVKRGFSWPAFFFTWIWCLTKGLFLATVMTLAVLFVAPQFGYAGIAAYGSAALFFGIKGNDLRRRKLMRQGFTPVGTIDARSRAEAMLKFVERRMAAPAPVPAPASAAPASFLQTRVSWVGVLAAIVGYVLVHLVLTMDLPWKQFNGDGFTVLFPREPKSETTASSNPLASAMTSLSARSRRGTEVYIGYVDFLTDKYDADGVYKGAREGAMKNYAEGSIIDDRPTTISGVPGRQLTMNGPKGRVSAKMLISGRRFYTLVATGRDEDVAKFFNSFALK